MRVQSLGIVLGIILLTSPAITQAQSADTDPSGREQVQSRSIRIFGCEVTPNVNALKNCLDDKIDDMVKNATTTLNRQVNDLRGTIDTIGRTPIMGCRVTPDIGQAADCINGKVERHVALEVAKATAMAEIQARNLERQKDNLERQVAELQNANPLGPAAAKFQKHVEALAVLSQMNLDAVNACLAAASSAQRDMVQLTHRFVSNPPSFPPYLIMEVWRQMDTNFDVIMQEELSGLRESAANGKLPQVDIVLDRSVRALKKLAERDPSAKCLYTAIEPHVPAMRLAARTVQQQLADRIMNLLQTKVLPAILDPVGQQMGQLFGQIMQSDMTGGSLGALLPNQKELDRIIRGVAAEQLIRPSHVRNVAQKLMAMSTSLGNPQQAQASLLALQKALDKQEVWPEEVAIQVAMEILRFSGHKWIDSDMPGAGAFVANLTVSTMGSAKDYVGNVTEAACGLIPELGAAVCAAFQQMIEVAYNYVSPPAMKIMISNIMHTGLDQAINETAKAYIQKYDPRQARQNMGPFASIVNSFPTREVVIAFAARDRSIREMQLALFDYNDSVRQFAETAVRR